MRSDSYYGCHLITCLCSLLLPHLYTVFYVADQCSRWVYYFDKNYQQQSIFVPNQSLRYIVSRLLAQYSLVLLQRPNLLMTLQHYRALAKLMAKLERKCCTQSARGLPYKKAQFTLVYLHLLFITLYNHTPSTQQLFMGKL